MKERRRATVFIDEDTIASMLELPPGVAVVSVQGDWLRSGVAVMIAGPGLFEVAPGEYPPNLVGRVEWDAQAKRIRLVRPEIGGES